MSKGTILCTFKWRNETLFLKTLQSGDRSLTLLKLRDDSDREGPGFCSMPDIINKMHKTIQK
jgi:hypothetical protein